jgi:hypothetical protein
MLVLQMERNTKRTVEMDSDDMTYVPSFMKIIIAVEGILRFGLSKWKCCIVGITNVRGIYEVRR